MRTLIIIPVLLFSLLLVAPSYSGDYKKFKKGMTAAQNGDWETALKGWKPLAKEGNALAQYNLGLMYRYGWGVLPDSKEAVRLWRLSADQGYVDAQYNLGAIYEQGKIVTQDYKEAVRWWQLAAEQGFVKAQYNLGHMYRLSLIHI